MAEFTSILFFEFLFFQSSLILIHYKQKYHPTPTKAKLNGLQSTQSEVLYCQTLLQQKAGHFLMFNKKIILPSTQIQNKSLYNIRINKSRMN